MPLKINLHISHYGKKLGGTKANVLINTIREVCLAMGHQRQHPINCC